MCSYMPNRYPVKRICRTETIVTDCLLPCGPTIWESLTIVSTQLPRRHLRSRVRNHVSLSNSFVCAVIFVIFNFLNVGLLSFMFPLNLPSIVHFVLCVGERQYSHDFLLQLRSCAASCVRPLDLELIPGVTCNTPGTIVNNVTYDCIVSPFS